MKKIILKGLKDALFSISLEEKQSAIKRLHDVMHMSFTDIAMELDRPKTTVFGWYKGREEQKKKQKKEYCIDYDIDALIKHFSRYKPKNGETEKLKRLAFIIMERIK